LKLICEINSELKKSSAVATLPKKENGEGSILYRRKVNILNTPPPPPPQKKKKNKNYKKKYLKEG